LIFFLIYAILYSQVLRRENKEDIMICPECKCEYLEGIKECIDCKIPLVEESQFEQESNPGFPRFVTFKTFPHRYEAHLARDYLDLCDIEAFVPHHQGDVVQPVIKYAYPGGFLMIKEEDVNETRKIFNDLPDLPEETDGEPSVFREIVQFVSAIMLLLIIFRLGVLFRELIGLLLEN
jgi:hypothetical protein